MKTHIYYSLAIVVACFLLTSCHTTQKYYVQGTPGTKIYNPSYQYVGEIGSDGRLNVSTDADSYQAFLLSQAPGSQTLVPFALDYEKHSYRGTKIKRVVGQVLTLFGLTGFMMGGIDLLAYGGDPVLGGAITLGAGAAVAIAGASMWDVNNQRLNQKSYDYQFKYLSNQNANTDIRFTQPVFNEPYRTRSTASQTTSSPSTTTTGSATASSTSTRHVTQRSTKTLRDYGQQVEGDYIGEGSLTRGGNIIETYKNIKVTLTRRGNEVVAVIVTENNGNNFFEAPSEYSVTKLSTGGYKLVNKEISSATITIDKNGQLVYNHPKVNIDGDVYTLKITAK